MFILPRGGSKIKDHLLAGSMSNFVAGLELSEAFYNEAVAPVLREHFDQVPHSAALIGSGSEVLGLDNEMSADHHWGPRVLLFLETEHHVRYQDEIKRVLSLHLPRTFRGYPTSFTEPDPADNGTQLLDESTEGPINHRVDVFTIEQFFQEYLCFDVKNELQPADWLSFPDQKLVTIVAGRVFHDDVGLEALRKKFSYYPHDVWLYLLAAAWKRIEQEEHLMGRAGYVGDEIGSAIIASRLVRDLMRLCFLMEKRYAPYPKWFGTAFLQLHAAKKLAPLFENVLRSAGWEQRQDHLRHAYEYVAELHNKLSITSPMPTEIRPFFTRPFLVISMGAFSTAICDAIKDPHVKALTDQRLIGGVDQWSDSTDLLSDPSWRLRIRALYT